MWCKFHIDAIICFAKFDCNLHYSTPLPLDKMATILAEDIFKCILLNENYRISGKIPLKYVPMSPTDKKPVLVQVMVWHMFDTKPIPDTMMTAIIDAYMRHLGGDELTLTM